MIRFGMIGTSSITDQFIRSASRIEGVSLSAIYSRSRDKATDFAAKHSIPHIFTDLDEMAQSNNIDAVYIASPNSLHASQSILFLQNRKHVLCEKPIASNLAELTEMIHTAKTHNTLLMEAMKSTFLPNFMAIKENIHKVGKIRRFTTSYCKYSSRYDAYKEGRNPNTFNPQFSNGSLMDLGHKPNLIL
jgi:predicted dehydrogenase